MPKTSSQNPGARAKKRVPKAAPCVFSGKNLALVQKINPERLYWNTQEHFREEYDLELPHRAIVSIAKAWGIALTEADCRGFQKQLEADIARSEAEDAARLAARASEPVCEVLQGEFIPSAVGAVNYMMAELRRLGYGRQTSH